MSQDLWRAAEDEQLADLDTFQDWIGSECSGRTVDQSYAGRIAYDAGKAAALDADPAKAIAGADVPVLVYLLMTADTLVAEAARDAIRAKYLAAQMDSTHDAYMRKQDALSDDGDRRHDERRDDSMGA